MDYQRHYDALIERARGRQLDGYVERHHVLPRCLGGGDEPENIAELTQEEHFLAHQLLVKLHPGDSRLVFAAWRLANRRWRDSNSFSWLRRLFASAMSSVWLGKSRPPFSEEHRAKIAAAQIGRKRGPHSDVHKARLSAAHSGKKLSEEHKQKLSLAKRGKVRGTYMQRACPHCGTVGGGGSMTRWHFDNCRSAV